jgi:SAM-dependent methyltransferase
LRTGESILACGRCETNYPIVDGVPVLLPPGLSAQQRAQTAYFDAEFGSYGSYRPENWRLSFVRRIFSALDVLGRGHPYLDVGVGGSGATVIEAARLGARSVGCDLSVAGVLQARGSAEAEGVDGLASFVACAAEALPFTDGSFGSASAVAVLEHLDDDLAAAQELHRVLRPGGCVWVTVPHAYRYIPPPLWPVYALHDRRLGHKRHYDAAHLVRTMAAAGLQLRTVAYSGHPIKIVQLLVDRLLGGSVGSRDRAWWRLESLDLRADGRARGALQLSAVFERPV